MKFILTICLAITSGLTLAAVKGHKMGEGKPNYIQQVFTNSSNMRLAVLHSSIPGTFAKGTLLKSYRWAFPTDSQRAIRVKTGEIKVVESKPGLLIGLVASDGSSLSQTIFKKHPGVMAGDELESKEVEIIAKTNILPEKSIRYETLFINPTRFEPDYELSDEGKKQLEDIALIYGHVRAQKLLISGHTDSTGSSENNQLESLQRAKAVRHQLIENYGFDPDRLVALGFGETEPAEAVYYPGVERVNRRIVFKVVSD